MSAPTPRPGILDIAPYKGGKSSADSAQRVIKLSSNEGALGPSPKAMEALRKSAERLHRYPDGGCDVLRHKLAEKYGLEFDQLICGNGSDEILTLLIRAYAGPGDEVLYSEHGFLMYPIATMGVGATPVTAKETNMTTDVDALLAAVTDKTKIVFVANPNNPTGTWIDCVALEAFLKRMPDHVVTVVDEAYFEYVDDADFPDAVALLRRWPGLIATRTFSKIYALAGLRIGYAVASSGITEVLNRVRQPFNVNSLGLVAASEALTETEFVQHSRRINKAGMVQLCQGFQKLGLEYIPSKGNFISVDVGGPAEAVYERLLRQGVIVRPVANYGMPQHLRITIGLEQENDQALTALETALAR